MNKYNSINERLKFLRKEVLKLTQSEFGNKLGLGKAAISKMESETSTITEQNIKFICKEFNVSYAWLVDGVGDIFINSDNVLIDELVKEYDLDDLELRLVETFLKLNKENRKVLLDYLKNVFIPENDELK